MNFIENKKKANGEKLCERLEHKHYNFTTYKELNKFRVCKNKIYSISKMYN